MAKETDSMADRARQQGAAGGAVVASWAWQSLAAAGVPTLVLILLIAIG
jgi:hypothetical protein